MKKKILSIVLSFSMIFSTTGFAFADVDLDNPPAEPTKPKVESYEDNNKIKEYNKEAGEYNKKADEYNAAIDKEYNNTVADINKKNSEGQQKQIESQKAHDDAIAANEAEQKRVDEENKKIDEENIKNSKEVEQYNLNEDAKAEQSKNDKEAAEVENAFIKEAYDKDVAMAESEYESAIQAERDRINKIKDELKIKIENEKIRKHNAEENQKVIDTNTQNELEKAKIDAENATREEKYLQDVAQYEADMIQYDIDYKQYQTDKKMEEKILSAKEANGNQRYHSIEEYNETVTNYNNQVIKYNNQVDAYNKTYKVTEEDVNNSISRNKNASPVSITDTYSIIKGETQSGRMIPVHIEHTFYGTDISYSEDFEIDANDIITLKGMSAAGDPLNDTSCCFFYNTDSNHTLGMWNNSWSMLLVNPTASSEYNWENGDVHTITYKDSTDEYQWYFEDISINYYYIWTPFYQKKNLYEYANTPTEPTLPTQPVLNLINFEPIVYNPNYLNELDETEIIIEKREVAEPKYIDVPELYTPEYKNFGSISYINPTFIEVPEVEKWENISIPPKKQHLNHIPLLKLFLKPTSSNSTTLITNKTTNVYYGMGDNEKPLNNINTPTTVNNIKTPFSSVSIEKHWALINLIATIIMNYSFSIIIITSY